MDLRRAKDDFFQERRTSNYSAAYFLQAGRSLDLFLYYLKAFHQIETAEGLTRKNIQAFVLHVLARKNKKNGRPISQGYRMLILGMVKTFCDYLTEAAALPIDVSPLSEIKFKKESLDKRILTESEMQKILSLPNALTYTGFRDRVIFELMYSLGLRKSEVPALEVYDLDFNAKTIFIRQGKGKKDRVVPLGRCLESYLREYLEKVRPALQLSNFSETKLFLGVTGAALSPRGLAAIIEKYSKLSGIKFSCHSLRHTFSTHMLRHGASIIYIQKILGHECLSTTEVYTRVFPEDLKRIILTHHPRNGLENSAEPIPLPTHKHIRQLKTARRRLAPVIAMPNPPLTDR